MTINPEPFGLTQEEAEQIDSGTRELVRRMIHGKSRAEKLAMAGALLRKQSLEHHDPLSIDAPRTPDELWDYIKDTWGIEIARTPACEDHDAPFDFICAGFFEWFPNIFEIGSRGGGKSFDMGLLHELNSRFKPGCESITFGAVVEQSQKVYADFTGFINGGMPDGDTEIIGESKAAETDFKNGSKVSCVPGTVAKVNGPHPPKAHSDEVELMRALVWKESRMLAADKILRDGSRIKAQNYGTSTMKYKNGRVDQIRKAFLSARDKALAMFGDDERKVRNHIAKTAPFYVFIFCIFEVSQQVPNCRLVAENKDLPEYDGHDYDDPEWPEHKCDCHLIESGKWDDGSTRTMDQVCRGRWHRSRGHRSRHEVVQLFIQNDRFYWQAQQECRETETEGLYVKSWSRSRHGLAEFVVDPANGPIYTGTDWGFTNEACVLWVQYLERPVTAVRYDLEPIILPARSRVTFSEIYKEGLVATELGQKAITREVELARHLSVSRVPVRKRWADVTGPGERKDWRKMGLKTSKYSTRSFESQVKEVRGMYEFDRAYVLIDHDERKVLGCPNYADEIEAWREEDGKEVGAEGGASDDARTHAMAAGRYVFYGMHDVYDDAGALMPDGRTMTEVARSRSNSSGPVVRTHGHRLSHDQDERRAVAADQGWRARL